MGELAQEICSGAARIAAATGRWLEAIAEFDRREGWAGHGIKSCAHWLSWKCGLSPVAAREHVRVARSLAGLPAIAAALAAGRLSYSAVRAVTRVADPDNEADLLAVGLTGPVAHVEKIVRGWRRVDRIQRREAENAAPPEPPTTSDQAHRPTAAAPDPDVTEDTDADADTWRLGLQTHWDDDGTLRLSGRLSAEDGAMVLAALTAARERLESQRPVRSPAERERDAWAAGGGGPYTPRRPVGQGAALVDLARSFLDPDPERQSAAARHQVVVHLDADVLADHAAAGQAHLDGGPALSAQQVSRIACDASLVVLLRRGREVLDIGRASRSIPSAISRALWVRDGGCRFPACGEQRRSRVQGHHIRHWSHGGSTSLDNLVLLCRTHHRGTHEGAFAVEMGRGGRPGFTDAHGHRLEESGMAAAEAVGSFTAELPAAAEGLLPQWGGERLDLGYAVSVLRDLHRHRRTRPEEGPAHAA